MTARANARPDAHPNAQTDIVGANAERARSHNRQVVLDRIRAAGEIGRAEIAKSSGLSTQAVSNIIADLSREGLIKEGGRRSGARGLPAVQYGLNPKGGYAIGVEVRPDAVFAAALDLCGKTVSSARQPLRSRDLDGVTQAVRDISAEVVQTAGGGVADRILGTGIVMPGPFEPTGLDGAPSELPIWHQDAPSPEAWFSDALGHPVIVENDANAAAMAERVTGVATGLRSFAYLYFGRGLGLGIIDQGRAVTGGFANAGEIGHIPVPYRGSTKLLEATVSRLSVQRHLARSGVAVESSEALEQAYAQGTPALGDWLEAAVEPLSYAVTVIENLLDPETIILGGAMPDPILDHLIGAVHLAERSVSARARRDTPRLLRGASGRLTATLGAAALVINRTFTPKISVAA